MKMDILLACSAGGHLTEMRQLRPFYAHYSYGFVTFARPDTESLAKTEKVHFITRPARNILSTLRAFVEANAVLAREKPKLIISTGADVAVPVCVLAKLRGIPIVWIESFCRPEQPSLSGRIVSLFATRVIYQWRELEKFYPSGIFGGSIFSSREVMV